MFNIEVYQFISQVLSGGHGAQQFAKSIPFLSWVPFLNGKIMPQLPSISFLILG